MAKVVVGELCILRGLYSDDPECSWPHGSYHDEDMHACTSSFGPAPSQAAAEAALNAGVSGQFPSSALCAACGAAHYEDGEAAAEQVAAMAGELPRSTSSAGAAQDEDGDCCDICLDGPKEIVVLPCGLMLRAQLRAISV